MTEHRRTAAPGRPVATSHAEIEQAAFRLFADRGFEGTTLAAIAGEVGVSRRTILRYYESKNDIPWGQFDRTLENFRAILQDVPRELALHDAIHRAVMQFNEFPPDASPSHRERMALILNTPALQAHSVLRYTQWRQLIANYVGERLELRPQALLPQAVGHVSLALALTAYDAWLADPDSDLAELLERSMVELRNYLKSTPLSK